MKRLVAAALLCATLSSTAGAVEPQLFPLGQPALEQKAERQVLVAADAGSAGEIQPAKEEKPQVRKHNWDTFWEVHFGGYRWLWWAGGAAVLVAIHAAAD